MITETNLQNIPRDKRIKRMFIPREGFVFVEADLSQAEPRIVAYRARERRLIDLYETGGDTHSMVASLLFGKKVVRGMPERQHAKPIANGSNYDMGPKQLADTFLKDTGTHLTIGEARKLQNLYHQQIPGIRGVYHREIRLELRRNNRVLTNPFGRRRRFWQPWGRELFKAAYSHYAQSTVADIVNESMNNCEKEITPLGIRMVAQVHDSLLFEVPSSAIDYEFNDLLKRIVTCMSIPFEIEGRKITIPVELKWGMNWGDMEEIKLGTN